MKIEVEHLLASAEEKSASDDYAGAIEDLSKAITLDPECAHAYDDRGFARYMNGDHDGALVDFGKAIELDPRNSRYYAHRAMVKEAEEDHAGAVEDYSSAIRLNPKEMSYHSSRAHVLSMAHRYDEAIADWDAILKHDPKEASAYSGRALQKSYKGDYAGALEDMGRAILLNPRHAHYYWCYGVIHTRAKQYDKAVSDLTRAIELEPNEPANFEARALARRFKGDLEGAIADYTKELSADPDAGQWLMDRGCIHRDQQRFADALKDFEGDCLEETLCDSCLYVWLTKTQMGEAREADQKLRERCGLPEPDEFLLAAARMLLGESNEQDLFRAAEKKSDDGIEYRRAVAYFFSGMKRLLKGDRAGAVELLKKCPEGTSEWASAREELKRLGA